MTPAEIERKRKRLEQLGSEASRTRGELDGVLKSLKSQFDVTSLAEARKLLREMEDAHAKLQDDCAALEAAFQERWGEKLDAS